MVKRIRQIFFYCSWTRDRAIEFMLNYTAYSEQSITTEVDRYLTWPGQACGYKIGELKIKELRAKAQKDLGNLYMPLFISSILAISASM